MINFEICLVFVEHDENVKAIHLWGKRSAENIKILRKSKWHNLYLTFRLFLVWSLIVEFFFSCLKSSSRPENFLDPWFVVIIAMEAHFIYSLSGQTVNSSSKFLSVTVTLHFTDYSWSYFQNCQRCFCKAAGGQNNNVTVSVNRWMGCNVAVGYERL